MKQTRNNPEQKFHCTLCKNVGGKNGRKYKCAAHRFICSDCVRTSGFFSVKYLCNECDKESIRYEWSDQKKKWEQT